MNNVPLLRHVITLVTMLLLVLLLATAVAAAMASVPRASPTGGFPTSKTVPSLKQDDDDENYICSKNYGPNTYPRGGVQPVQR